MNERSLINSILSLLRICSVFLAAVSFWSTAKGMEAFVFDTGWQPYGASFAVQGILLGLSLMSPKLWKQSKGILIKIFLVLLSLIVLFCSSWFSYVYIVENIYEDSWDTESMILIQNKYREHLYKEKDYTDAYKKVLESSINEQLSSLYTQAQNLKTEASASQISLNLDEERQRYSEDKTVYSEMSSIFNALDSALAPEATAENINHAQEIVTAMRDTLTNRESTTQTQLSDLSTNILNAQTNLENAQNDLRLAMRDGTNIDTAQARVDNLSASLEQYQIQQDDYTKQLQDIKDAIARIDFYEQSLNTLSKSSFNTITGSLLEIQKELIKEDSNIEYMIQKTTTLYEKIENSSKNGTAENSINLLIKMNTFIQQLTDYQELKQNQVVIKELQNIETIKSKSAWNSYLEKLKNSIAKVPVSFMDDENDNLQFNKTEATEELNELLRLYISKHNVAQQGIIYLFNSPHPALALFALILALFLDIASFIVGVAIEIHNRRCTVANIEANYEYENEISNSGNTAVVNIDIKSEHENEAFASDEELYSTASCSREYLIFTGDYEKIENRYIYQVIENGKLSQYTTNQYIDNPGIYVKSEDTIKLIQEQNLCFDLGKEQDGIYQACYFSYFEERLSIRKSNEQDYKFLANISEEVFVYKMTRDNLEIEPIDCLFNTYAEKIVLALNQNKTKIVSVFMIDLR